VVSWVGQRGLGLILLDFFLRQSFSGKSENRFGPVLISLYHEVYETPPPPQSPLDHLPRRGAGGWVFLLLVAAGPGVVGEAGDGGDVERGCEEVE